MRVVGAVAGNSVHLAVNMMETALQDMNSVRQLSFIPEYGKYIGLGSLGTHANLHYAGYSYCEASYVAAKLLAQLLVTIRVTGESF